MSRKPENTFITSVHKYLPPELYWMKNNNLYNAGIADCWYSGYDADMWIEYKFVVLPKRWNTAIHFDVSKLQNEWLVGRHHENRNVAVIVGCKEGGIILQDFEWQDDMLAEEFSRRVIPRAALAEWIGAICIRRPKNVTRRPARKTAR